MAEHTNAPTQAARYLGALALLATGAVHLQQYFAVYYRVIPVIGPLFLANFILALLLGVALLAPIHRLGRWAPALAAGAGIAFAAGTTLGLAISEASALFGFHEHGYRPAIVSSLVFEGAAIVLLTVYLARYLARYLASERRRTLHTRGRAAMHADTRSSVPYPTHG